MKKILFLLLFLSFPLFSASKLSIVGATTVQPIIEQVAKQYSKETGIILNIQGGGSKFGIDSVRLNNADIGMMNRALFEDEKKEVEYLTIAYDSLVFIVNKDNPLNNITSELVYEIFSGQINNWSKINGKNVDIILISKDPGRGTMQNFTSIFELFHPLDKRNANRKKMIPPSAWDARGNNDSLVWTGGLHNVIAFVSYGSAQASIKKDMPIKILKLDGIEPNKDTIANNIYKIRLELNVVYKNTNLEAKKFVHWLLKKYAQNIVKENGFIGVKENEQ